MKHSLLATAFALSIGAAVSTASADDGSDLAQQLANPVAAIISVPFQLNFDDNLGLADTGSRTTLNFQPVVPFSLSNGANVVTRTIMPYVWQEDIVPGTSQQGFGDILFNAWYSRTSPGGVVWGVGPILRVPTYSEVSTDTWGAGITGILLTSRGPWTYGALANHVWDIEKDPTTPTSASFLQPFVSLNTPNAMTYSLTSEATYDWVSEQWSVPLNLNVAKLAPVRGVPVNWSAGIGYWLESPAAGPEGWRIRVQAQIVIPKG